MYVYLMRSQQDENRKYVGLTSNIDRRLAEHNEGKAAATYKFKPWKLEVAFWFAEENKAKAFESYLKSGSGREFANKRLWRNDNHK